MADVVFAKVEGPISADFGGCGIKGVACMGNGRMLAIVEETLGGGQPYPQRVFRSEDNGLTWTDIGHHPSTHNLWLWKAHGIALDTVLVGNEGPDQCGPASDDDGIAITRDGGDTWSKATESDLIVYDCSQTFDMMGFFNLDNDEVWSVGAFGEFGDYWQILKSTDGGLSFPTASRSRIGQHVQLFAGAYCGNDVIVVGGNVLPSHSPGNRNARVFRSTDRGDNWTEIMLPNTQHPASAASTSGNVWSIRYLGDDVLLACGGQAQGSGYFPPKLWRSTDAGATWAEITDSLPDWLTNKTVPAQDMVSYPDGRAVIGIIGKPDDLGGSNWRLTEDYGVTWSTCTVSSHSRATNISATIQQMALADDGAVLVTIQHAGAGDLGEIWRGAPTFISAGPCADFEADTAGTLTVPSGLECVPSFTPPFCPPECPPASTITYSTPPAVATQAGYASFLPVLGLMLGGITVGATVPAGCGPAFTSEPCDRVEIT